jgi:hypothetical protein
MSKGMRRFSWLALLLWLGCGEAASDGSSSTAAEGDGEVSGAALPGARDTASPEAAPSSATASGSTTAASSAGVPGKASGPTLTPTASAPATGKSAPGGMTSAAPATTPAAGGVSTGAMAPAAPSGAAGSGAEAPAADSDAAAKPPKSDPGQLRPGVLTAGAWDDNRNFDRFLKYRKQLADKQLAGMLQTKDEEHQAAQKEFAQTTAKQKLDVSLVIDTTGSMGDEISYLQSEFLALSEAIEDKYPDAEQRWSLVVYRDMGDEYVTRWFDFRDDAMDFRNKLGEQSAGGGGDFPEAPDAALKAMADLDWRTEDNVARLVFWVADAPHHNENKGAMLDAIHGAHDRGVHLYPVASSGVDELTEVTMRSAAQLTGGRYLFLTNDSGVGGDHKEPSIPCYFVTKLNSAILRMVSIEMSGTYSEPVADDIIRSSGDPKDGSCKLESGEVVQSF